MKNVRVLAYDIASCRRHTISRVYGSLDRAAKWTHLDDTEGLFGDQLIVLVVDRKRSDSLYRPWRFVHPEEQFAQRHIGRTKNIDNSHHKW